MTYVIATLFSAAVWLSANRLILSGRKKPMSPIARGYLLISTVVVAMTTLLAVVLAVAAVE